MRGRYKLIIHDYGTAELWCDGQAVWASDSDGEFAQALGDDFVCSEDEDGIAEVLEYLVIEGHLSDYQADHCVIELPAGADGAEPRPRPDDDEHDDDDEELDDEADEQADDLIEGEPP